MGKRPSPEFSKVNESVGPSHERSTYVITVEQLACACLPVIEVGTVNKAGQSEPAQSLKNRMIRISHRPGVHWSPQRPSPGPLSPRQLPPFEPRRPSEGHNREHR